MRKPPTRSHKAAAYCALAGCGVIAFGATQPWIVVKGPDVSIGIRDIVDFTPNTTVDFNGTTSGATSGLLAGTAVGVLFCLILAGTRRWDGVLLRLPLLIGGASVAFLGGYLIHDADTAISRSAAGLGGISGLYLGIAHTFVTVSPGIGAYALAAGGAVVAIGSLLPSKPVQPTVVYVQASGQPDTGHVVATTRSEATDETTKTTRRRRRSGS